MEHKRIVDISEGAGRSERPRLLLVIGSLEGGGAERQLSVLANHWVAKGFSVTVATWAGPEVRDFYPLDRRVRRVYLQVKKRSGERLPTLRAALRRVSKLRALLLVLRPHVVLSFLTESNVLTILAGMGVKTRIVVSERVNPAMHTTLPRVWKVSRRLSYKCADEVVAQTSDAADWIRRNCLRKAIVIPNVLRPLPEACAERQPLIVAVGRLAHQKGFDLLLHAFARIAAECSGWKVMIIGEGGERAKLMDLVRDLMLTDRVVFAGQLKNVEVWMAHAGIVVQPSRFEGFPNAVLESMAMGAAVISSDCPSGPADLIDDGVNGRLVPVEDVGSLSRAMAELIAQPDLRRRLGKEAVKVRERFHQDLIMAQWEACLLQNSAAHAPASVLTT